MTLHTVMPLEMVLAGMDRESDYQFADIQWKGVGLQIQWLNAAEAKIIRLHSANPQHYLDPQFAPGTIIRGLQQA